MKNWKKLLLTAGIHLGGWALFVFLNLALFINDERISSDYEFLFLGFNLIQFMVLFYPSIYYAIPRFLHQRKIKPYIGFSLTLVFIATLGDLLPAIFFESPNLFINITIQDEALSQFLYYQSEAFPNHAILVYFLSYLFLNIWYLIGISALKLVYDAIRHRYEMEVMTREKLQSELKFLREQNNPHFLFNNLNSLYVLIDEDPATAQKMLVKLSNMLRYQLYDASSDRIPVQKEFDYIRNYIDLQQLRYSEELEVNLDLTEVPDACHIEPYLLFTLVENAFKHGVDAQTDEHYLRVSAEFNKDWLIFRVENPVSKKESAPNQAKEQSGFGLANLKKRLNLLYPEAHHYEVENGADFYRTTLKLQLACH